LLYSAASSRARARLPVRRSRSASTISIPLVAESARWATVAGEGHCFTGCSRRP
jgi:hypothetical protein